MIRKKNGGKLMDTKSESLWNQYINMCYRKYQKYVNQTQLPTFDTEFGELRNTNSWARFHADDLFEKKYMLHINPILFKSHKPYQESVLFHEFTHLLDSIRYFTDDREKFAQILFYYSEYHASLIEMKKLYNLSLDKKTRDTNKMISYSDHYEKVLDYVVQEFSEIRKLFEKALQTPQECYVAAIRHFIYMIGKISVFEDDIFDLIIDDQLTQFNAVLKPMLERIIAALRKSDINLVLESCLIIDKFYKDQLARNKLLSTFKICELEQVGITDIYTVTIENYGDIIRKLADIGLCDII